VSSVAGVGRMDMERAPVCVLVVDDEDAIVHALADSALEIVKDDEPAVALLDIVLPGMSGLKLAGRIKSRWPRCEVLMITGQSSVDSVVEAIQQGAADYLAKPFDSLEGVWSKVERALEKRALAERKRDLLERA
jgi:DNA-binding NtrC family response regulator